MSDLIGSITALYIYPIKSCAGLSVKSAEITPHGLLYDRQWLIVDQTGRFQTQRQIPHLVWITPSVGAHTLTLSAPAQPEITITTASADQHFATREVQIWNDRVPALDMGPLANQWLNDYLQVPGKTFHLVQFDPRATRLSDRQWTGDQQATVQFADGFAINVISEASVALFNQKRLEHDMDPIEVDRFRPNIVVAGLEAHDEDNIKTMVIPTASGPIEWVLVKPCPRCQIPDIDPQTSISDPSITMLLSSYRKLAHMDHAICFGMNGIVHTGAGKQLQVGQSLQASLNF
jgi:uncharacterized protein